MSASVVAVINTSPDTVALLTTVLECAGFVTVFGYTHDIRDGRMDLGAFIRQHQPQVIVYDIAPPYEQNWRFFEHLRETILKGRVFVITSTNAARVEGLAGRTPRIYEVVGKPLDLDAIVAAAREALHARPTGIGRWKGPVSAALAAEVASVSPRPP
jgi:CheY-like chemotaxis protein